MPAFDMLVANLAEVEGVARPAACRALAELMEQKPTVCLREAAVHGGLAPVWFAEASCQFRAADALKGPGVPFEATQGEADRRGSEKTALQFMLRWCAPLVFVWGSRWLAGALRHQSKALGPWPHVSRKLAMAIKHTPSRAHGGMHLRCASAATVVTAASQYASNLAIDGSALANGSGGPHSSARRGWGGRGSSKRQRIFM